MKEGKDPNRRRRRRKRVWEIIDKKKGRKKEKGIIWVEYSAYKNNSLELILKHPNEE